MAPSRQRRPWRGLPAGDGTLDVGEEAAAEASAVVGCEGDADDMAEPRAVSCARLYVRPAPGGALAVVSALGLVGPL